MKTNHKNNIKSQDQTNQFPCSHCGAMLKYQPGTQHQVCDYCEHKSTIVEKQKIIKEYDLQQALIELEKASHTSSATIEQVHCNACGASFKFASSTHAGECPFCGMDIVNNLEASKHLHPKSILPFLIDDKHAKEKFNLWLNSLWFAPNEIKKYVRNKTKLQGIYLPYWTYDSNAESSYTGSRGDTYYVRQKVRYVRNGRMISTTKRIPKIRWTDVRGHVFRYFDDVLIGASLSLPRQILDHLQPWDLESLVPYNDKYISGFQSEVYQLELSEGFDQAKEKMDHIIYRDITYDIGGDHQRIHHVNTQHSNTTYKHCLLPVWSAAFLYRNKSYRFIINGRTGQVQGERPYSFWKIALAVIAGLLVILAGFSFLEHSGAFDQSEFSEYYPLIR